MSESKTSLLILSFICKKKFHKCDVTCSWTRYYYYALGPLSLSQIVTPSRTPSPSSVMYFMYGPKPEIVTFQVFKKPRLFYKNQCTRCFPLLDVSPVDDARIEAL